MSNEDFEQTVFRNKVDHFTRNTRQNESVLDRTFFPFEGTATPVEEVDTYEQRYWINDKYWDKENGPVFVYICGEWTCSPPDDRNFWAMVGAEHGALLVSLEHRYYGDS